MILISQLFLAVQVFGQMPTNGNYSNWNWEDQSQSNWRKGTDGVWNDINAPFLATTSRVGSMGDIYIKSDYTKAKGWKLVNASFGPDVVYPYFILYNKYRGIFRVFFYQGDNVPYTKAAATCSYSLSSPKPGILSLGNKTQTAPDKYLQSTSLGNDMIVVVIPDGATTRHWAAADFPLLFDPNIKSSSYIDARMEVKLYGINNYNIRLKGQGATTTDEEQARQHSFVGKKSDIEVSTANQLKSDNTKLLKTIKTLDETRASLKKAIDKIDDKQPKFLQTLKTEYSQADVGLEFLFKNAKKISGTLGTVLDIFDLFFGLGPNSSSATSPVINYQFIDLEGTMDIQQTLAATTITVPGANTSTTNTNLFNCPIGIFNLGVTPSINVTTPYTRNACPNYIYISNKPVDVLSGYNGKYVKYKLDQNIDLVYNVIPNMQLSDVKMALLFKPKTATNPQNTYKITDKYISTQRFTISLDGKTVDASLENPVYRDLMEGKMVVHEFDEANSDVYFGSPYLDKNCLKGITYEVPETSEVYLGVVASFTVTGSDEPVIFSAKYNLDKVTVTAADPIRSCIQEQTTFPYSDYFPITFYYKLESGPNSSSYTAQTIELSPGFSASAGFTANATSAFVTCIGSTSSSPKDFQCAGNGRVSFENNQEPVNSEKVLIAPNPTNGNVTISFSDKEFDKSGIIILDILGQIIQQIDEVNHTESVNIDLSNHPSGLYFIKVFTKEGIITKKIVLNK